MKEHIMYYEDFGNIRIRTYKAQEALPVEGALVKIYGSDEYDRDIAYSLLTDSDGMTRSLSLPTPSKKYSTAPGAAETPYSVYNIEIVKEGFYPKKIDNVPIFSGISAVLPIEMLPLIYNSSGEITPQSNLNSIVYENEHLH